MITVVLTASTHADQYGTRRGLLVFMEVRRPNQSDFEPERGKNIAPGLRLPIGFPDCNSWEDLRTSPCAISY